MFFGPPNHVLAPTVGARWIDAIAALPNAEDALVSVAMHTGDPVRDVPAATLALGRIFGEDLPSGRVLTPVDALTSSHRSG